MVIVITHAQQKQQMITTENYGLVLVVVVFGSNLEVKQYCENRKATSFSTHETMKRMPVEELLSHNNGTSKE